MLSALITILIGNVILGSLVKPLLDQLRDTRDELKSITLPITNPLWVSFNPRKLAPGEVQNDWDKARYELNEIYRKYSLAYRPFKKMGLIFLIALVLLANAAIGATSFGLEAKITLGVLTTAAILILSWLISDEVYPSPPQVWNLDYLASHYQNIHPDSFIKLMQIGPLIIRPDGRSHLALSCAIHLSGYKYFVAMTNEDESKVHCISLGSVGKKTKVTHEVRPDFYHWYISLGEVDSNWPAGLELPVNVHLYIFLPVPAGWQNTISTPYFVTHELWLKNPDEKI